MKPSTFMSIEIYGLIIGLFGAQLLGLGLLFLPSLSDNANKLFYSDQPGAAVMAMLITMGMIGSLFFLINVLQSRAAKWHYRLTGFTVFYLALVLISFLSR